MSLTELVAELDTLIARWRRAREILVSALPSASAAVPSTPELSLGTIDPLEFPAPTIPTESSPMPHAASALDSHALASFPAKPGIATADPPRTHPVPITILKPRLPRERRSNSRIVLTPRTALNGTIPLGPIAISPRDLTQAGTAHPPRPAVVVVPAPPAAGSSFDDLVAEVARRTRFS